MSAPGDLSSLADPTRARILRLIRESEEGRALVGRLAEVLGLRQPTVSHHMKALHEDGIVVREPDGRRVWYSIAADQHDRIDALLGGAMSVTEPDLERIANDLTLRFHGVFSPESVHAAVVDSHDLLASRSRSPMIASRTASFAAARLDAMKQVSGRPSATPTVLFVCVQNAGRSQIAAGILRQLAGDRVAVRTAGSQPASDVRQAIVATLDEIGVPLGGEFPKPLTDEVVRAADVVITMGCGDACPIFPGKRYEDWELDDPAGQGIEAVRPIRDEIRARVEGLLADLLPPRGGD